MELSARNRLKGQVVRVKSSSVMAEVEIKRLKLKAGDKIAVIIEATEVLFGK